MGIWFSFLFSVGGKVHLFIGLKNDFFALVFLNIDGNRVFSCFNYFLIFSRVVHVATLKYCSLILEHILNMSHVSFAQFSYLVQRKQTDSVFK